MKLISLLKGLFRHKEQEQEINLNNIPTAEELMDDADILCTHDVDCKVIHRNKTTISRKPIKCTHDGCSNLMGGVNKFVCPFCGLSYCGEHHLPEEHNCTKLIRDWKCFK